MSVPPPGESRERLGFLASGGFVCLASVRDVYLGGFFQRVNPLLVALLAFSLCTVLFSPAVFACHRKNAILPRQISKLIWLNVTTAAAWLTFLFALKLIEPLMVQILYSGIGPLSVVWIERNFAAADCNHSLTRAERRAFLALLVTLILSATIVLLGLSGTVGESFGNAVLGVLFASSGGVLISISTMQCRKLNEAGVTPAALLSLRFPATALTAAAMMSITSSPAGALSGLDPMMAMTVLLIIVPSYVNLVAISLASPLTVRVVLAAGPVLIFFWEMVEGRLAASPYSFLAAVSYALTTLFAVVARERAVRN